jgi:glycosyltransferase involved in cell wall biosynthesis
VVKLKSETGSGISVILCTHNPRPDYLRRVLNALDAQTLPKEEWELLIIDNASETPLAEEWNVSWHPRAKHIREHTIGLTPARLRGIAESSSDILVYVDDDNVLAPDYLQTAGALLREHPYLGVVGAGILEPEFEVQPSPELVDHLGWLGLKRASEARWSNDTNEHGSVPLGAGLCVTRRVAQSYVQLLQQFAIHQIMDRRGERLFGHGDIVFSWSAALLGQGFGVFPSLRITHLIRAERVTQRYFLALIYDSSYTAGVCDYLWKGVVPGDDVSLGEQYFRLCLRGIRRGLFAMRLGWAALRGADSAREFIKHQCLQPWTRGAATLCR